MHSEHYRWVSYWKTIRSTGYLSIETLFYRNFCRQKNISSTIYSLLCWELNFLAPIFYFWGSTCWRPNLLVTRRFVAVPFWHFNVFYARLTGINTIFSSSMKLSGSCFKSRWYVDMFFEVWKTLGEIRYLVLKVLTLPRLCPHCTSDAVAWGEWPDFS